MRRPLSRLLLGAVLLGAPAVSVAVPPAPPPGLGMPSMEVESHTTLVSPGGPVRQVLGYKPRVGATGAFETRTSQKMTMSLTGPDGNAMPMPMGDLMPTTVIVTRNTVKPTNAAGKTPVVVELGDIRLEGGAPEMAGPMQSLDGSKFEMLLGANGRPESMRVLEGSDPAMAELVRGMADQMVKKMAIFPEEPVGVGAKWTTVMDANVGGIALAMTQTSTLRAVTETAVDLDMVLTMSMGDGGFHPPGMPPGMNLDVTRFAGNGTGTTHIDLTNLVASGSNTMDIEMAMKMAMPAGMTPDGGAGSMAMAMTMHQTTEMRAVP